MTSFYYEEVVLACEAEKAPGNAACVLSGTPDHPVTPEIFLERTGGKPLVWRSSNVVFSEKSPCPLGRDYRQYMQRAHDLRVDESMNALGTVGLSVVPAH